MARKADRRHVYVINDPPAILDLLGELLEGEGYRVTLDTFNPLALEDKLAEIKRARPYLAILDFVVGGEAIGWQLLQLMKMDREARTIPVVVCTAAVRQAEELQPHLAELGVTVVLKPFDIDHLLEEVAKVWARPPGAPAP